MLEKNRSVKRRVNVKRSKLWCVWGANGTKKTKAQHPVRKWDAKRQKKRRCAAGEKRRGKRREPGKNFSIVLGEKNAVPPLIKQISHPWGKWYLIYDYPLDLRGLNSQGSEIRLQEPKFTSLNPKNQLSEPRNWLAEAPKLTRRGPKIDPEILIIASQRPKIYSQSAKVTLRDQKSTSRGQNATHVYPKSTLIDSWRPKSTLRGINATHIWVPQTNFSTIIVNVGNVQNN